VIDVVATARRIGEELLFPRALETDTAALVPAANLDALAEAGLYGLAGPVEAGGLDADFPTACAAIEELAAACLTTAFVWTQHHGVVLPVRFSERPGIREEWLEALCSGRVRAGVALAGLQPEPPLHARAKGDGWLLSGVSPWVTGWGRVDVLHVAARGADGGVVWTLVDAHESPTLRAEALRLVAVNASGTVRVHFDEHLVPAERVTGVSPAASPVSVEVHRINGSLALGVIRCCCRLLGESTLDDALDACRDVLDAATPETIWEARAAASELAVRAAATLTVSEGSGSILLDRHAQRLAREAFFLLVFASRPPLRDALLVRLAANQQRDSSR
jgi:alkylation response protein AidB-like acyl-CoA dehydrogenase